MAALLSPTGVRVKLEHSGGGCPVTVGELHAPGGDYIISHYYKDNNYHSLVLNENICAVHWFCYFHTVPQADVMMG